MQFLFEVLNFIMNNYIKFSIGVVLVIMAVIGYYAEKTNFGNKLKKEDPKKSKDDVDLNNVGINDLIEKKVEANTETVDEVEKNSLKDSDENPKEEEVDEEVTEETVEPKEEEVNEEFLEETNQPVQENDDNIDLDETFKSSVSLDDKSDDDLMLDIDNMQVDPLESFDKDNEIALSKLNKNIDLPDIDNLDNDDIWKF